MQLKVNGGLFDLNGQSGVVSTLISDTASLAGTVANNATGVSTFTVGGNANGGNGTSTFYGQFVDNTNAGTGQLRLERTARAPSPSVPPPRTPAAPSSPRAR